MDDYAINREGGFLQFLYRNNIFLFLIVIYLNFNFIICQNNRDCPENFTLNPQYPAIEPECYPNEFNYYSSVNLAYYLFNLVTINDVDIAPEDWVGAFTCNEWQDNQCIDYGTCVGAREWGACNASTCDVPVFGDDGSEFTDGYMTTQSGNNIPCFKIYDASENIYIDAIPSLNVEWSLFNSPIIELLFSFASIQGCTDQFACNFNPYASEDDNSCDYCSCSLDPSIVSNWEYVSGPSGNEVISDYNNYEFNGSITARVLLDNQEIGSEGDIIGAFIDNELRGISFADLVPDPLGGGYVFNIMVFSNSPSSSIITFRYYNSLNNYVLCLDETINFSSDMIIGSAIDSYNFNILSDWLSADTNPQSFSIDYAYPNPFNPSINIKYSIDEASEITFYFYNIFGQLIEENNIGYLTNGNYSLLWEPKGNVSGVYFVVMSNGIEKNVRKITLLK